MKRFTLIEWAAVFTALAALLLFLAGCTPVEGNKPPPEIPPHAPDAPRPSANPAAEPPPVHRPVACGGAVLLISEPKAEPPAKPTSVVGPATPATVKVPEVTAELLPPADKTAKPEPKAEPLRIVIIPILLPVPRVEEKVVTKTVPVPFPVPIPIPVLRTEATTKVVPVPIPMPVVKTVETRVPQPVAVPAALAADPAELERLQRLDEKYRPWE